MFEILAHPVSLVGSHLYRAEHTGVLDDPITILVNHLEHIL